MLVLLLLLLLLLPSLLRLAFCCCCGLCCCGWGHGVEELFEFCTESCKRRCVCPLVIIQPLFNRFSDFILTNQLLLFLLLKVFIPLDSFLSFPVSLLPSCVRCFWCAKTCTRPKDGNRVEQDPGDPNKDDSNRVASQINDNRHRPSGHWIYMASVTSGEALGTSWKIDQTCHRH